MPDSAFCTLQFIDYLPIFEHGFQTYQDLIAQFGLLPTFALHDFYFDHALVAEEIVLAGPTKQLDFENERAATRDLISSTRITVSIL